ncbi:MAG: MXAN_6640 family putative metalloprotease [Anaerolineae bacterium]
MPRYRNIALIMLVLLLSATLVHAQQTVTQEEGSITEDEPTADFEIELEEGQTVVINVETTHGDLDPILTLSDSNEDAVAENDDRGILDLNSRLIYTAEDNDTYVASVSGYDDSTGDFIIVFRVGGDELLDNPYGEEAQVFDGEIQGRRGEEAFDFDLNEGDTIFLETEATSGELDTILTFYNSDGDPVAENDDRSRQTYNSALVYTAEDTDTYTAVVTGYDGSEGEFLLIATIGGEDVAEDVKNTDVVDSSTEYMDGEINEDTDAVDFSIELEEGDTVLLQTEAQDEELDTILSLYDPNGDLVEENDDINTARGNYNSGIAHTAETSGEYTATVSSYGSSQGEFTLEITIGGEELIDQLNAAKSARVELSGPELTRETEHFIIHYTTEGADAADEDYIDELENIMETVWTTEIDEMGWPAPPTDGTNGGDERYDVYVQTLLQDGLFGYCAPELPTGDNPNTDIVEENAAPSFFVVENDMAEDPAGRDAIGQLFTTAAHEFHHAVQFGFDTNDEKWMYEAVSTWMETKVAGEFEDATPYVSGNFQYPEICFGYKEDTYVYGHWLFIQSLADAYGDEVVQELWTNAIELDGFDALEQTLEDHGDDIPIAFARYNVQNLLRVYDLADEFDATVWMENVIDDTGRWTFTGNGIQELAANYYQLDLPDGVYNARFRDDSTDGALQMWVIGIDGDNADVIALGDDGSFSSEGYDYVYLMVFNALYDNDLDSCDYYDYEIQIEDGDSALDVTYTWDASHFEPLEAQN